MPSGAYDGTIGRIYMEKIDAATRSSTCDRCRTRTAVYELHWFDNSAPVRGLCQHCADAELTTYELDMARGMGLERECITESKLHATAEELTRLAEWYGGGTSSSSSHHRSWKRSSLDTTELRTGVS